MVQKAATVTEASAVAAAAVAISLAFSGAWIAAALAGGIAVALFAAYKYLDMSGIKLTEEQIERIAEEGEDAIEDILDDIEQKDGSE